jgi:hypothetical protein
MDMLVIFYAIMAALFFGEGAYFRGKYMFSRNRDYIERSTNAITAAIFWIIIFVYYSVK